MMARVRLRQVALAAAREEFRLRAEVCTDMGTPFGATPKEMGEGTGSEDCIGRPGGTGIVEKD
jgi:hypothetical protein